MRKQPCSTCSSAAPGLRVSRLCLGTMNFGPLTLREPTASRSWTARSSSASTSSTRPTSTAGRPARASPSRSSAAGSRRAAAGASESCSPPRSTAAWARARTTRGFRRAHIRRACDESLRRLQTDHIDLYQMHHVDRDTPWDEIWQAMEQLVAQGKVLYVGSSNFAGWHIAQANAAAARAALPRAGLRAEPLQPHRAHGRARGDARRAARTALGVIPWSPLAGGLARRRAAARRARAGAPRERIAEASRAQARAQLEALGGPLPRARRRRRPTSRSPGCCTIPR